MIHAVIEDFEGEVLERLELPALPPPGWIVELPSGRWALVHGGFIRLDGQIVLDVEYLSEGTVPAAAAHRARSPWLAQVRPLVELAVVHGERQEAGERALGEALPPRSVGDEGPPDA